MGATAQARSTLTLCPFNSTIHLTRRLRKRLAHHRRDFLRDVTLARFQSLQEPFAQCDAVLQRYVTPGTLNDGRVGELSERAGFVDELDLSCDAAGVRVVHRQHAGMAHARCGVAGVDDTWGSTRQHPTAGGGGAHACESTQCGSGSHG